MIIIDSEWLFYQDCYQNIDIIIDEIENSELLIDITIVILMAMLIVAMIIIMTKRVSGQRPGPRPWATGLPWKAGESVACPLPIVSHTSSRILECSRATCPS